MPLPQVNGFYEIRDIADWATAQDESLSPCILMEDIDVAGGSIRENFREIDLNGKSVLNIGNVITAGGATERWLIFGSNPIYNGTITFQYSTSVLSEFRPFRTSVSGTEKLNLGGSVTVSGAGRSAYAIGSINPYETMNDIISTIDVTADNCYVFKSRTYASSADKIIYGGTLNGTTNGITETIADATAIINSFYDSNKNTITEPQAGMAKSTLDLQNITTYTDTVNTTGLTEAYSIEEEVSHTNETWILPTSSYPNVATTSAPIWNPYTVNGIALPGIVVKYWSYDDRETKSNPVLVQTVTSDAQGNAPLTNTVPATQHLEVTATYTVPSTNTPTGFTAGDTYASIPKWIEGFPS